jgi:hypothetical protein
MLDEWSGPVMAYPDSGSNDMAKTWRYRTVVNEESATELTDAAKEWVEMGVQVVGACCGFGAEYIMPMRDALPDKIAQPRGPSIPLVAVCHQPYSSPSMPMTESIFARHDEAVRGL